MVLPTGLADTNIFSTLHYDGTNDAAINRCLATNEWWKFERKYIRLYAAASIEIELSRGDFRGQKQALAECKRLPYLRSNKEADTHALMLIQAGLIPPTEKADAFHLALATVHRVDYLITWNYAHLANDVIKERLEAFNRKHGYSNPIIVTPLSIPWHTMGQ